MRSEIRQLRAATSEVVVACAVEVVDRIVAAVGAVVAGSSATRSSEDRKRATPAAIATRSTPPTTIPVSRPTLRFCTPARPARYRHYPMVS
jgi:hypothetical protein